eukprot:scaffold261_cov170-Amphora_coffeaeformis.AAC.10
MNTQSRRQQQQKRQKYVNAGTIWAFWEGDPPDLILRCIETVRSNNKSRPIVIVSKATLPLFLDESDYLTFDGQPGGPDSFSAVQYLADWVRIVLLEKYGGIWFDASVICTSTVESWISDDPNKITMFPMHANPNIHGNWTMASPKPNHPLLKAWRSEFARVLNEVGPRRVPTEFCQNAFVEYPTLDEIWNKPSSPPLPYLWVYLVLQVVLQKEPELHSTIFLRPSIDGPMYRWYLINVEEGVTDADEISRKTAEHLACQPFQNDSFDRFFIKLVGKDRAPIQEHLDAQIFQEGSAMESLSRVPAREFRYGSFLKRSVKVNAAANTNRASRRTSITRNSIDLLETPAQLLAALKAFDMSRSNLLIDLEETVVEEETKDQEEETPASVRRVSGKAVLTETLEVDVAMDCRSSSVLLIEIV